MDSFLLILTVLASGHHSVAADGCDSTEYKCADGTCKPSDIWCDNFPDCADGSDETNCPASSCLEGQKRCIDINGHVTCQEPNAKCDCGPTLEISHGNIKANGTTEGSEAMVSCDEGYIPSTSNVICQENGKWSGAVCNVTVCGQLPPLLNGILTPTDPSNFTFGATAKVECTIGFEPSTTVVVCLSTGHWGTATCTLIVSGTTSREDGKGSTCKYMNSDSNDRHNRWISIFLLIGFAAHTLT